MDRWTKRAKGVRFVHLSIYRLTKKQPAHPTPNHQYVESFSRAGCAGCAGYFGGMTIPISMRVSERQARCLHTWMTCRSSWTPDRWMWRAWAWQACRSWWDSGSRGDETSVKTQKLKSTIMKRFIAISVCYFKIVFVSLYPQKDEMTNIQKTNIVLALVCAVLAVLCVLSILDKWAIFD